MTNTTRPNPDPPSDKADITNQKRWTTVLFADLEDFTGISERGSAENTYELISEVVQQFRLLIEEFHGHPIDFAGDSVLAAFGAPIAVENASLNACRAAVKLQAYMAQNAQRFQTRFGVTPKLRIGLAGGVIVVGHLGIDANPGLNVLGDAVNLASRIQNLAQGGEILCTRSVYDQVEGFAEMTALPPQAIKGLAEPVEVLRLNSLGDAKTTFEGRLRRGATTFVGRGPDLDTLRNWVARAPGMASILDVSGQAGIGKSRILHEAFKGLGPSQRLLTANCNLDLKSKPLAALIELMRQAASEEDDPSRDAIDAFYAPVLGSDAPGYTSLVEFVHRGGSASISIDSDTAVYVRTLMGRALLHLCAAPGFIIVFEDIHWLDDASASVIASMIKTAEGPLKLLTTRRREYAFEWLKGHRVVPLALGPISMDSTSDLACNLLGVREIPVALAEFLVVNSEGNALFLEEMVRFLRRTNQITISDGRVTFDPTSSGVSNIGNLQHLILSNFDTLPAEQKTHLTTAAFKGRRVSEAFLSACFGDPPRIRHSLNVAQSHGLLEPDPSGRPGEWQFSHALIGTAIRDGVLSSQRSKIHASIAATLEAGDTEDIAANTEELAYHYDRAGQLEKAVHYLWKSAQNAFAVYSVAQADSQLERAFAIIETTPTVVSDQDFVAMLVTWGKTLEVYGDFRKLNRVMITHLPRARDSGMQGDYAICLTMRALSRTFAGEQKLAKDLVDEALRLAQDANASHAVAWAKAAMIPIYTYSGIKSFDQVMQIYEDISRNDLYFDDPHIHSIVRYYMTSFYRSYGMIAQAREQVEEGLAIGRQKSDARTLSFLGNADGLLRAVMGDLQAALDAIGEAKRYSVPDTGAARVSELHSAAISQFLGKSKLDPVAFDAERQRAEEFEDRNFVIGSHLNKSRVLLVQGKIDAAWRELQLMERSVLEFAIPETRNRFRLFKADVLLAVAGQNPMPKNPDAPKPGLRDVARALLLRPTALRQAERNLDLVDADMPLEIGEIRAQSLHKRGLIQMARGHRDQGRALLSRSRDLFAGEGMQTRADWIDEVLAEIA